MRERAPLGVLPGQPDRNPVLEQGGERERLGVAPVDPAFAEALAPALELARELRVHLELVRHLQQLIAELDETVSRDGGHHGCARIGSRRDLRRGYRRVEARPELVVRGAQLLERVLEHSSRLVRLHDAVGHESLRVRLAHRDLLLDALGLQRLRVRGLVLLVVAEAPVADEVDDDVVAELLAVREGEPDG